MPTEAKMAVVAAIIALAFPALAAGNDNRDNQDTYKSAQYCMPPSDELPSTTYVYC
jgi:hypothetical protein